MKDYSNIKYNYYEKYASIIEQEAYKENSLKLRLYRNFLDRLKDKIYVRIAKIFKNEEEIYSQYRKAIYLILNGKISKHQYFKNLLKNK